MAHITYEGRTVRQFHPVNAGLFHLAYGFCLADKLSWYSEMLAYMICLPYSPMSSNFTDKYVHHSSPSFSPPSLPLPVPYTHYFQTTQTRKICLMRKSSTIFGTPLKCRIKGLLEALNCLLQRRTAIKRRQSLHFSDFANVKKKK